MDIHELFGLTTYLHQLYEERFPELNADMTRLWYEDLKHLDEATAHDAVRRWVRQHTFKAPSLDELLEQGEILQAERRHARRGESTPTRYLDVLQDAADTEARNPERSDDDATYARYMVLLAERSIEPWEDEQGVRHGKMTQEQRGDQCYPWAEKVRPTRPQLAKDLEAAGRQFLLTLPLEFGD